MATAGDRHETLTGNIWSYAHRGDLTGVKAALRRGVDINLTNTVGWTACHAAAAGGQTKTLRFLLKAGANAHINDTGGQQPMHHAAKNGHVQALHILATLGNADLTQVRLSQGKGPGVRQVLLDALKKAGKEAKEEDSDNETNPVVGYARKQSKSTAFWGPRKTPISGKIKKKILKERRQKKQTKKSNNLVQEAESEGEEEDCKEMVDVASEQVVYANENKPGQQQGEQRDLSNSAIPVAASSYQETVQSVKRERKSRRRQRQKSKDTRRESNDEEVLLNRQEDEDSSSTTRRSRNNHDWGGNEANNGELDFTLLQKVAELEEESSTSSSSFGAEQPHESFGGVFAALAVHDSENDSYDE